MISTRDAIAHLFPIRPSPITMVMAVAYKKPQLRGIVMRNWIAPAVHAAIQEHLAKPKPARGPGRKYKYTYVERR